MSDVAIQVLRPEAARSKKTNLTIRVPAELHERIGRIRAAALQHAVHFAVSEIVQSALLGACEYAEQQLFDLNVQRSGSSTDEGTNGVP